MISGDAAAAHSQPIQFDTVTRVLFGLLGLIALVIIGEKLRQAVYVVPINYNEGWNAFHALRFLETGSPYPPRGGLTSNNYPPLWFPVVAAVGKISSSLVMSARIVATLGFVMVLVFCADVGRQLRGAWGAVAALICVGAVLATQGEPYIGMGDPQFFAQGVSAGALVLAARAGNARDVRYVLAIVLAVFAGFVKHNLAALPAALIVASLFEGRAAVLRAMLAAASALILGYLVSATVGGWSWPVNMLVSRGYSYGHTVNLTIPFLTLNAIGIALAGLGLRTLPKGHMRRVLLGYLVMALPIASVFAGGSGVWINTFFDSMVAIALCASLLVGAVAYYPSMLAAQLPKQLPRWWGAAAVSLWLLVGGLYEFRDFIHNVRNTEPVAAREARYKADIEYLRSVPGAAVCDMPAMCYLAGKEFIYDPFAGQQAQLKGALTPEQIRDILLAANVNVYHVVGAPPYEKNVPQPMIPDVTEHFSTARVNTDGAFLVRHTTALRR